MDYDIKDIKLKDEGLSRIKWADGFMPVLKKIRDEFKREKPLKGFTIGACLHVTTETANLMITLKEGGADVYLTASNPLSTQDDVAAALVHYYKIPVFAIKGEDNKTYYEHIKSVLSYNPHITMDDGADLISTLHREMKDKIKNVLGGTEETTTGVIRLKSMAKEGVLMYPVIAVNDSDTKHLFDNRYGTGQSTIDGILRATNILFAGLYVVVAGYGWCGRGIAMRARGMGAKVIVTEVDPVKAIEAVMDGFMVMKMIDAAPFGDVFITATGCKDVIGKSVFNLMKDNAIVCNAGHFDVEINKKELEEMSVDKKKVRENVEQFVMKDGRRINLLSEGRLVNLSAAEGHPAMVMDMSFANQALATKFIKENHKELKKQVYKLPQEIDKEIAFLKLQTMGIDIDNLTEEQKKYLSSWEEGT
uniref:Adenosylhomocysteinase n=1 Tax=candidate division WOR-3 bacterium TaxID=2052148 RepID=A0A7C4Y5P0_UNCW3